MIAVTLRFDERDLPVDGADQGKFVMQMLKEQPQFAMQAAQQIELTGPFGRITEER